MEEIINSNLLHMACMLLCIAIVACVFINHYAKGKDVDSNDKKIQKLHTFYVTGILVFIIIELATGICMRQDNHNEILSYVSFAATLSSLIMSVVAIIFTIVYSSRGEEQYKKIDNASDKVSASLDEFSKRTHDIDNSVSLFKDTSDALTIKMEAILADLKDVKSMTEEIKDTTSNNQVSNDVGVTNFTWKTDNKRTNKILEDLVEKLIKTGSFNGNCALYACVLSKESGKSFSITDISIATPAAISYRYGYLVAASALGIIEGDIKRDCCSIKYYYSSIKQLLEKYFTESISKAIDKERKQLRLDQINSFFNSDKPKAE